MGDTYYYGNGDGRRRSRRSLFGRAADGVLVVLTIAAGAALVLTLAAPFVPPGRLWIFPVLGLVAPAVYVGVLLLTLYWIVRWRWGRALPLLLLLLLGACRVPLFLNPDLRRHYGEEPRRRRGEIVLMSYNVRSFYDDRGRECSDSVAALILRENPDIVCLQEFNKTAKGLERFDSLLPGYFRTVYAPSLPAGRKNPVYRQVIYSKFRLLGGSHSILEPRSQNGRSIWVDLLAGDDTLRVFNNHLHSTSITASDDQFLSQHRFLTDTAGGERIRNIFRRFRDNCAMRATEADTIARVIAATGGTKIVCGDFNDTPMSYVYRKMARGLDDAFRESGTGYSHTFRGFLDALRIDFVLFSDDLECLSYKVLEDAEYSDHYPVLVRLRPRPDTE